MGGKVLSFNLLRVLLFLLHRTYLSRSFSNAFQTRLLCCSTKAFEFALNYHHSSYLLAFQTPITCSDELSALEQEQRIMIPGYPVLAPALSIALYIYRRLQCTSSLLQQTITPDTTSAALITERRLAVYIHQTSRKTARNPYSQ